MDKPRPLTPDDADALLPLIVALGAHHGQASKAAAHALGRDIEAGWLWGFGLGDPLVAYALVHPAPRAQDGLRGVELHHLFVAEPVRRRGLARRLIEAVEADARRRGCSYVRIGAVEGNAGARACYEAAGYAFSEPRFWRFRKTL